MRLGTVTLLLWPCQLTERAQADLIGALVTVIPRRVLCSALRLI